MWERKLTPCWSGRMSIFISGCLKFTSPDERVELTDQPEHPAKPPIVKYQYLEGYTRDNPRGKRPVAHYPNVTFHKGASSCSGRTPGPCHYKLGTQSQPHFVEFAHVASLRRPTRRCDERGMAVLLCHVHSGIRSVSIQQHQSYVSIPQR
jgi:hypothetical protein